MLVSSLTWYWTGAWPCETPRQDCRSEGDQGPVWETDGTCQVNRDINQKEAIGNYEFTLTPRALFAPDGTVLPCHDKSKLIHLLDKLAREHVPDQDPQQTQGENATGQEAMDTDSTSTDPPSRKIALVDGMVLVQKLSKKPETVVTVKDLSGFFNDRLMSLTRDTMRSFSCSTHTGKNL